MPKQLYIPLPCAAARQQMILRQMRDVRSALSDQDMNKVVAKTEGYSGSDMRNLIQEACQGPIRDAVKQGGGAALRTLRDDDLRPVVLLDFAVAARAQRASVEVAEVVRYEEYNEKHGAKYVGEEDVAEEILEDW